MRHLLALALVVACTGGTPTTPDADGLAREVRSASSTPSVAPTPTEWSAEARTACATTLFQLLVEAINSGDRDKLERIFRQAQAEHPFQWVSMPLPSGHWVSYGATGAVDTLLERHRAGERWEALSVASSQGPSWHGGVDFAVRLTRAAPDLPGARLAATGKGAGSCPSGRIYVLSLGTD